MIDDLPGELTVTTRDKERDRWLRDYSFRKPDDNVSPGTEPWAQASTVADLVTPQYFDIKTVADATDPTKIRGKELKTRAESDGVVRLEAFGASGSVESDGSVGGGTIYVGDVIVANGLRFECNQTSLYFPGDPVPIIGIDTGLATNLAAGTVMKWDSPRPGIATNATVVSQTDGSGLSGGKPQETEDEYRDRWNREKQRRAASGNDAEIQETAEQTFGVAVEKAFTHPGILGSGTTCIVFTLKPATSGGNRIPNSTQRDAVLAYVTGLMPKDEGILMAALVSQQVDLVLNVDWDETTFGWADLNPWPAYYAATGQAVIVDTVTDATHFVLKSFNGNYSGITPPAAGRTIGFYDRPNATFRRKKILSVAGAGPWTIVCDTTNSASDEGYVPIAAQRALPWSESLQSLVQPVKDYFATFGPGEQVAAFFDPGARQKRSPASPKTFPNVITTKGTESALEIANVFDVTVAEPTLPFATGIGLPGIQSNLIELGYVSAFPLS